MKLGPCLLSAFALVALAARPSPAAAAPRPEAATGLAHSTLEQAVHAFVADRHELVRIELLSSTSGRESYRLEGTATGRRQEAWVDSKAPAAPGGTGHPATKAYNVVGGSTRCVAYFYKDNNYGNLILTTDMDWNDLGVASGLNDVISSLQTTCGGLWIYTDANSNTGWPALVYYAPSYTNLATLPTINNAISSFKHDLP